MNDHPMFLRFDELAMTWDELVDFCKERWGKMPIEDDSGYIRVEDIH